MSDPSPASHGSSAGDAGSAAARPESATTKLAPATTPDDAPTIITRLARADVVESGLAGLVQGRRLAHFELEEPLGVGGMAAVIRARDTQLDRKVALKVLPPESARDEDLVRRFQNEARAAAKLDHENIARVYYCGADQGLHFIAFEYVEGENLRTLLERRGKLPVAEAVQYVLQVALGLAHAASRGVVHRDIKPSNIIVGEGGRAKLVDMGLARTLEAPADQAITHSGMTLGTFDYISPEQALEPRLADVRSDIYSLGCTFYHLVTGRAPVPEGTAARKLQFHQNELPTDPRQLNPEVSDEVAAILSRMMAKNAADRYPQPELLVQHLLQVAAKASGQPSPRPEQEYLLVDSVLPAEPRMRPLALTACAAVVLSVLVFALAPLFEADAPPDNMVQRDTGPRRASPSATRPAPTRSERPFETDPQTPSRVVATARTPQELRSAIAAAVADNKSCYVELEGGVFDLAHDDAGLFDQTPTIAVSRGQIVVHAKAGSRPVLKLAYHPGNLFDKDRDWALFALTGGSLTLSGLTLELDPGDAENALIHFLVQNGQLTLRNCEVDIKGGSLAEAGDAPAVLKVIAGGTTPPRVLAYNTVFTGGARGFVLEDGADVLLRDCGIGVYQAPFHLVSTAEAHRLPAAITLTDSTWLVGPGPQVRLESRRACRVQMRQCVVGKAAAGGPATLFAVGKDQPPSETRLEGEGNRYFDLEWLIAKEQEPLFNDRGSRVESIAPWATADPANLIAKRDVNGFKLRTDAVELRRPAATDAMLGAQRLLGTDLYGKLEPMETVAPPSAREYIVDGVRGRTSYETLADALSASDKDGREEAILILKLDGNVPTRTLEIGSRRITIRAAPGYQPELSLHPDSVAGDAGLTALFRLQGGNLTLEGVRVRLGGAGAAGHRILSLVSIVGSGACKLRQCLATLEEGEHEVAVITVNDPPTTAPLKPPRVSTAPIIEMEDCFFRGQGDLVTIQGGKLQRLHLENVLAALEGTLLSIDGHRGEGMMASTLASISLRRVTAVVSQSFLSMRTSKERPQHLRLQVQASNCLFAASGTNPLLRLEGPQSEEELRGNWMQWQGSRNLYAASSPLILWMPLELNAMPSSYDSERWSELWGRDDENPRFQRSPKFVNFPAAEKTLQTIEPADFAFPATTPPDMELEETGADLRRLPLWKNRE